MDTIIRFYKAHEAIFNIIAWVIGVGAVVVPLLIFSIRAFHERWIRRTLPAWLVSTHPPALPDRSPSRKTWPTPFKKPANDRVYLIGTDITSNQVGFVVRLNLEAGQSATFFDLHNLITAETYRKDRHSAAWNEWVAKVGHEIPYPSPGIPLTNSEEWIRYGRDASHRLKLKLEPKGFRRSTRS